MEIICLVLSGALVAALCLVFYYRGLLSAARADMARQREDFDRINAASEERFKEMAAQALASNSESLRKASVNSMAEVLAPMRENIENFRRTISERYTEEARERFALGKSLQQLMTLSRAVSDETARLTSALKGNSRVQGEWGEMVLDNILRAAGFRKGFEYTVQTSGQTDEGQRLRPDVIINYDGDNHIVIDSKVSIQDYLKMIEADSDASRDAYARAHLASVRKHIGELARKPYRDLAGQNTFDYVLMFVPNEGAFLSAINLDPQLWQTAMDGHVIIISPTHLLAVVKLIEQMWRQDKQNRNALAIAEEAGKMLNKFSAFLEDMARIEKSVGQAGETLREAMRKLSTGTGSLVSRAQKIEQLGAKAKKSLPQRFIDDGDEETE